MKNKKNMVIETASWLDVLDELHIWMYCIFGCVVYLDELVIIGLGIRLRQGFRVGITGRI